MLAPTSHRQRWKTASIRKDCRDAYAYVTSFAFSPDLSSLMVVYFRRRAIAEMETEADMVAEPDAMETGMDEIVAEHSAMAMDPEVGPENAVGEPQLDAMETETVNIAAEELAAPAG